MANWKVTSTLRQPRTESYIVKMTVNGESCYSTELDASLHGVLIGIAEKMLPGDLIETHEGFSYVHIPEMEKNN